MISTIAPTETVAFTTMEPKKEERIAKALGKAMKKYPLPLGGGGPSGGGGGPPGGGGFPGGGGPPGGGGSPGGAAVPAPAQPPAPNQDVRPIGSPPSIFHRERA